VVVEQALDTSAGGFRVKRSGFLLAAVATTLLMTAGAVAQQPAWVAQLGYRPDEAFAVRRGHLGMPFLQVAIGDSTYWLLFDTGNMVGLTLATSLLDQLRLPESGRWDRLDSGGRVIGRYRQVRAPVVRLLGGVLADQTIYEFSDAALGGLVGPDALPGTRFTLDYRAGILAVTRSSLQVVPPGFTALPLVRSSRHPGLILALGRINGRPVLIEFDTGRAGATSIRPWFRSSTFRRQTTEYGSTPRPSGPLSLPYPPRGSIPKPA
jgi:hypothetical protein